MSLNLLESNTLSLYPIPYRLVHVCIRYTDKKWRWPVFGFVELKEKSYFVVGGFSFYLGLRLVK